MFTNAWDYIELVLVIAIGVALAEYVPRLFLWIVNAVKIAMNAVKTSSSTEDGKNVNL